MNKHNRIIDLVNTLAKNMPSRSITVKVRTGWDDKHPTTHKLVPMLQKSIQGKISALMVSILPYFFYRVDYALLVGLCLSFRFTDAADCNVTPVWPIGTTSYRQRRHRTSRSL